MRTFLFVLATSVLALSVRAETGPGRSGPRHCRLDTKWSTVDTVERSIAQAATASDDGVFVAGTVFVAPASIWTTRRSRDRGESWKTVDQFRLAPDKESNANGAAVDPKSGDIYVVGQARAATGSFPHWIVRKSRDGGKTWKTVDDFLYSATAGGDARAVAVDSAGVIYVVGDSNSVRWLTRRSTDGGAHWETVDDFQVGSGPFLAFAVATPAAGKVFVGGLSNQVVPGAWAVRFSANSGANWATIDEFVLKSGKESSAHGAAAMRDGTVVFVGTAVGADNKVHWISREANVDAPGTWKTIDDFTTSKPLQPRPFAATFSKKGTLFVTGGLATFSAEPGVYLTRREKRGGGFEDSDSVLGGGGGNEINASTFGLAATTGTSGDVFTAGVLFRDNQTPLQWIVRRLECVR